VRTKVGVLIAALALVGLTIGAVWVGSASADAKRDKFTRVVFFEELEFAEANEGAEATSVGDEFVFSGPLRNKNGRGELGRIDGRCVVTSAPGPAEDVRQLCVVTATGLPVGDAPGAELEMQGVGRELAEDVDLGITGGTGVYKRAGGYATFDFRQQDRIVITFNVARL
jgi:hypothetical protein